MIMPYVDDDSEQSSTLNTQKEHIYFLVLNSESENVTSVLPVSFVVN
jgi:hypothetical protein